MRAEVLMCLCLFLSLDGSLLFRSRLHLSPSTRGLRELTVVVGEGVEGRRCREVVAGVKESLVLASRALHTALRGKVLLETVTVQVPSSWGQEDCGQQLQTSSHVGVRQALKGMATRKIMKFN